MVYTGASLDLDSTLVGFIAKVSQKVNTFLTGPNVL